MPSLFKLYLIYAWYRALYMIYFKQFYLKEKLFATQAFYRKLRKMFLSPRRESNPQPSDLR